MYQNTRNQKGYSLMELMVTVLVMLVILSLFYLYNNQGWRDYQKIIGFSNLSLNSKSLVEFLINDIREASSEYLYIGSSFNSVVPLPSNASFNAPYLYFAKFNPDKKLSKVKGLKDNISTNLKGTYDFLLFYLSNSYDNQGKAKYKLRYIKFLDNSKTYVNSQAKNWPILPEKKEKPSIFNSVKESDNIIRGSFNYDFNIIGNTPNFALKDSKINFSIVNQDFNPDNKLIFINVKLVDPRSKSFIDIDTAIKPRN